MDDRQHAGRVGVGEVFPVLEELIEARPQPLDLRGSAGEIHVEDPCLCGGEVLGNRGGVSLHCGCEVLPPAGGHDLSYECELGVDVWAAVIADQGLAQGGQGIQAGEAVLTERDERDSWSVVSVEVDVGELVEELAHRFGGVRKVQSRGRAATERETDHARLGLEAQHVRNVGDQLVMRADLEHVGHRGNTYSG